MSQAEPWWTNTAGFLVNVFHVASMVCESISVYTIDPQNSNQGESRNVRAFKQVPAQCHADATQTTQDHLALLEIVGGTADEAEAQWCRKFLTHFASGSWKRHEGWKTPSHLPAIYKPRDFTGIFQGPGTLFSVPCLLCQQVPANSAVFPINHSFFSMNVWFWTVLTSIEKSIIFEQTRKNHAKTISTLDIRVYQ